MPATYYYTKDQVRRCLRDWDAGDAPLPTRKTKLIVSFPPPAVLNVAEVTLAEEKSTYGKRLYKIVMHAGS